MTTLKHPHFPGWEIQVPDDEVSAYVATGWIAPATKKRTPKPSPASGEESPSEENA